MFCSALNARSAAYSSPSSSIARSAGSRRARTASAIWGRSPTASRSAPAAEDPLLGADRTTPTRDRRQIPRPGYARGRGQDQRRDRQAHPAAAHRRRTQAVLPGERRPRRDGRLRRAGPRRGRDDGEARRAGRPPCAVASGGNAKRATMIEFYDTADLVGAGLGWPLANFDDPDDFFARERSPLAPPPPPPPPRAPPPRPRGGGGGGGGGSGGGGGGGRGGGGGGGGGGGRERERERERETAARPAGGYCCPPPGLVRPS